MPAFEGSPNTLPAQSPGILYAPYGRFPPDNVPYNKRIIWQMRFGQEGSFAGTLGGFGNDGVGATQLDTMLPFNGAPSMRMVTSSTASNSGTVPPTISSPDQNITKRRINSFNRAAGRFWFGFYFWPSWINDNNTAFTFGMYNRDGTNRYQAAAWLELDASPAFKILTAATPTWTNITTYDWGQTQASFNGNWSANSGAGGGGIAGNWHYVEMGVDFGTQKYLYAVINDKFFDLTSNSFISTADASAKVLHFTMQLGRINSSAAQNWVNIADPVGGIIF